MVVVVVFVASCSPDADFTMMAVIYFFSFVAGRCPVEEAHVRLPEAVLYIFARGLPSDGCPRGQKFVSAKPVIGSTRSANENRDPAWILAKTRRKNAA